MLALAALAAAVYAFVNAFGAWMVSRRQPALAGLFMLAATVLIVAAAALISPIPFARALLASGLVLASLASLINAYLIGQVRWQNHLLRAAVALLIYLLAHWGIGS
ncbi:MAG: hypothetical protein KGZ60_12690 [Truepera sp.]|nr:hypothetical protein [Truepera sp.]